jgi:spermidine synthase
MASYNQASERALAHHALEVVMTSSASGLRVLVGGLGMGLTLQETLSRNVASVDVVEVSPYIIEWNRTHFAPLNAHALADPRVRLIQNDLYTVLCASPEAAYHAILLDVDNGPSWLAHADNARLYTLAALERWSALLVPGGSFAVWSAQPEPEFLKSLQAVFGQAEELSVADRNQEDAPVEYFIYRGVSPFSTLKAYP